MPSLKILLLVVTAHKCWSKFEFQPIRKQYFVIWIEVYVLAWQEKDTFKLGFYLDPVLYTVAL